MAMGAIKYSIDVLLLKKWFITKVAQIVLSKSSVSCPYSHMVTRRTINLSRIFGSCDCNATDNLSSPITKQLKFQLRRIG